MVLLSAFEDFVVRTLGVFSGPLARLAYLGSLRSNGEYQHWGLARTFGDAAASAAISEAHTQVWLEVLRTPLRKLVGELNTAPQESALEQVTGWSKQVPALTPLNIAGGSRRHFHSILLAISLIPQASPENTPPDSRHSAS